MVKQKKHNIKQIYVNQQVKKKNYKRNYNHQNNKNKKYKLKKQFLIQIIILIKNVKKFKINNQNANIILMNNY